MAKTLRDAWPINRRALLGAALAIPALNSASAATAPFFQEHDLPIGLQLYTLGPAPAQDLNRTLSRVAAIGYRTVEFPSLYKPAVELRAALDAAALSCPSVHDPLSNDASFDRMAAAAAVIGFKTVVVPIFSFPPGVSFHPQVVGEAPTDIIGRIGQAMTPADWTRQAERLNAAGARLRPHGVGVGYHNHNVEFAPGLDGRCGYDILLAETDPALVTFELDVGWVAAAGRDPLEYLRLHPGRFRLMHVKDIRASTRPNFALRQDPAEVGDGRLDWTRILPAAYAAGVRDFYVEQEPPFTIDRFESARLSFDYLKRLVA